MEIKKNKSVDYNLYRFLFLGIGLCVSLVCVFIAFEAQAQYEPKPLPDNPSPFTIWIPVIPPTEFPKKTESIKPKPKTQSFTIVTEPVKEMLREFVKETIDEPIFDEPIIDWIDTGYIDPSDEPTPFLIVEDEASFPGGSDAWVKFLRRNIKYPRLAKRSNIEGKVFLSFYVDADGMISDIKVIRGIGAGCDEEAIRVLKKSPRWNPGRQRGNPVKSPMSLFIHFVLK